MKVVRFTDSELDCLRFAAADKMLQLQKQVVAGQINNDEAVITEIAMLGQVVQKCNRLFPLKRVA